MVEKRKRGRPKGSKNRKPPEPAPLTAELRARTPDPLAALIGTNNTGKARDFTVPARSFVCEGCGDEKPTEEFGRYLHAVADAKNRKLEGEDAPPPDCLCDYCASYGPPMENPLAQLSQPEIDALAVLAAGGSMRRAAVVMGVSERQIRSYLTGREKNVLRAAYQKLLLQIGVTPQRLAKVVFEALDAMKPHYDKDGNLSLYPDHATRLKAAQMGQKILQLEQPTELSARSPEEHGPALHFHTNLGDGTTVADDAYVIDIRPANPMKQVN